jgi:hypothetical protein
MATQNFWNIIKAIPLGLGVPIMIGMTSVKPEDAASNFAAWLNYFGIKKLPSWVNTQNADKYILFIAITIALLYVFGVWVVPIMWKKYQSRNDGPPIGSLRYATSGFEIMHSHSKNAYAGRIKVELFNETDKLIQFHAKTAGRINGIAFDENKIEFDGYVQPRSVAYLFSVRLSEIPILEHKGVTEPSVHGIYEYDIRYKYADQKTFARRTARGLNMSYWAPITTKPIGTTSVGRVDVIFYDEKEE